MKTIGVLSDTHLTAPSGLLHTVKQKIRNKRTIADLRAIVQQHFSGVDLILHAGDVVETTVLDMLRELAPVEAVRGNMDSAAIQNSFPSQKVLEIENRKIGLTHGDTTPQGIVERVTQLFTNVDAIVFGHTHQPMNEMRDGILFFNPGSPTDRIFAPYTSIGILKVTDVIKGEVIRL